MQLQSTTYMFSSRTNNKVRFDVDEKFICYHFNIDSYKLTSVSR